MLEARVGAQTSAGPFAIHRRGSDQDNIDQPKHVAGGRLAQLVEQLTLNQRVAGSNPASPTNLFNDLRLRQKI